MANRIYVFSGPTRTICVRDNGRDIVDRVNVLMDGVCKTLDVPHRPIQYPTVMAAIQKTGVYTFPFDSGVITTVYNITRIEL